MNALAEVLGTCIFVFLYFLFLQRNSQQITAHGISIHVAASIGLSYFVGVYLPFYTYRIHIFPFVSFAEAAHRKKYNRLIQKLLSQLAGSFLGLTVFLTFFYEEADFSLLGVPPADESELTLGFFHQVALVAVVGLFYHYMRFYSKAHHAYGHFLMAVILTIMLYLGSSWWALSAINSFGLLILSFVSTVSIFESGVLGSFLLHLIAPLLGVALARWLIILIGGKASPSKKHKNKTHAES